MMTYVLCLECGWEESTFGRYDRCPKCGSTDLVQFSLEYEFQDV